MAAGTTAELVTRALGTARVLAVHLSEPHAADAGLPEGWSSNEAHTTLRVTVKDLVADVPRRLAEAARVGDVRGMDVTGASLQDVFIALTGRELRE